LAFIGSTVVAPSALLGKWIFILCWTVLRAFLFIQQWLILSTPANFSLSNAAWVKPDVTDKSETHTSYSMDCKDFAHICPAPRASGCWVDQLRAPADWCKTGARHLPVGWQAKDDLFADCDGRWYGRTSNTTAHLFHLGKAIMKVNKDFLYVQSMTKIGNVFRCKFLNRVVLIFPGHRQSGVWP
jgi:hypothetical protein